MDSLAELEENLTELGLVHYRCAACLYVCEQWKQQCPSCASFGRLVSFVQEVPRRFRENVPSVLRPPQRMINKGSDREPIVISKMNSSRDEDDIDSNTKKKVKNRVQAIGKIVAQKVIRVETGVEPLDRVLGGGAVVGTTILLGGAPGVGKSTLLLQTLAGLTKDGPALYACGEEDPKKIAARAKRLGLLSNKHFAQNLFTQSGNCWEEVLEAIDKVEPYTIVIDSLQVFDSEEANGHRGSDSQVKFITQELSDIARELEAVIFIVCHETKNKKFAGPRTVEHLVDVSLMMTHHESLPGVVIIEPLKNREGSITERGAFQMTDEHGLVPYEIGEGPVYNKPAPKKFVKPHRVATKQKTKKKR